MSIQIRTTEGIGDVQQNGYSISPVLQTRFTDWNGGLAVADKPENRRDDVLLERPTMEMGNRTELGYEKSEVVPPSESAAVDGKSLYARLDSHNRDNWWKYRKDSAVSKSADNGFKIGLIFAFASELGLNSFQKQRTLRRLFQLDLRRGTGGTEVNGFLLCALVANEDAKRYDSEKLYHPQRSPDKNDDSFQKLEDALRDRFPRVTKSALTKVFNKLSQGSPPTRAPERWKRIVKRNSEIPQNPSFVTEVHHPQSDTK